MVIASVIGVNRGVVVDVIIVIVTTFIVLNITCIYSIL